MKTFENVWFTQDFNLPLTLQKKGENRRNGEEFVPK